MTPHIVTTKNNFMSSLCFGSLDNAKVCASGRVLFDVRTAGRVLWDGGEEESVEE